MVGVVVFPEILREIPSLSVGYFEDGTSVFLCNFVYHKQDCKISLKLGIIILIFITTKL
jgi:hypothetical protein